MKTNQLGRRQFLHSSILGLAGATTLAAAPGALSAQQAAPPSAAEQAPLKVKGFRTLGRTGFRVSDIGAGSIYDQGVL
ncbi:MAG: hypothetical protein MUP19_02080, partial [Candidatus Aminicenantes bacterium]|nr:hypothetical protein [Candidatus Aminicenantes bacterium]